jgi:Putative Ig domain
VNPGAVCLPSAIDLTGNTASSGTTGNIRTFTGSNGVQVKASGWSREKGAGVWAKAYLGAYPLGLGVTDVGEDGSDPSHRVDNVGTRVNYVLFEFSTPVIVNRAFLDAVGVDSDISVWVGNKTNPFVNHLTLSDSLLSSLGTFEENLTTSSSSRWADINGGNIQGNVLVIAALASDTSPEDEFKISKLDLACPTTPGKPTASCVVVNAVQGIPITAVTMTATGGAGAPYTFTATGLPTGLTMSSTGTLSGTPTVTGTFSYTVTIKDKNGVAGTVNCSLTVNAAPVCLGTVFDTTGNTASTGTTGNVRTFTAPNGLQVKASGWSRDKSAGAWAKAYLGAYSPGLGVTDTSENGSDPTHKVDNVGTRVNYVLFEFSAPVVVNRAFLDSVGADSDVSVWIGTTTDPFNNHLTLSDALLAGFGAVEENSTTSTAARWADFNNGNKSGNVLVIAALASDTSAEDEFKISKIETTCLPAAPYKTFTQGGWGATPSGSNPGALLSAKFSTVYPGGSVAIGGTYKLTFTSASAIANFLPQGSTAGKLTSNATNPTTSSAGVLAGQVLALQLSVDFSNKGVTPTGLANLKVVSGPAAGLTVAQVLSTTNSILGGAALPSGFTYADVVDILDQINNAFDGGTINTGYIK